MTSHTVQHTARSKTTRGRDATDPEQLFAAAWSACFLDALRLAGRRLDVTLPGGLAVEAEVDLCSLDADAFLRARFVIHMPGLERDVAESLVDLARRVCPYTKATLGNIEVTIRVA